MSDLSLKNISPWFWIVAVVALLWNLMGVYAYYDQLTMTPEALAALPEAQQGLYKDLPSWVNVAFGVAVNGGALGSICLLMKKKLALPFFVLSLIGVLVQMFYNFFMADTMEVYGPGAIAMPVMILIFAVFLVFFSKKAIANNWIS